MDDLSLLDDLDRRLGPLVPDVPVPADLLTRARAARRRRSTVRAAAVAAVVTLVAGVGFVVADRPTGTPDDVAGGPTAADVTPVPDGFRMVGYDGVAVAVPEGWIVGQASCLAGSVGDPARLSLIAPGSADRCLATPAVTVSSSDASLSEDVVPDRSCPSTGRCVPPVARPDTINGLGVIRVDHCSPSALCLAEFDSVDIPALGVTVTATAGTRAGRATIISSIRPMPYGMTAVPPIDLPADFDTVCRALVAAALLPPSGSVSCHDDVFADVTALRPAPGSVVPEWSVVEPVVRY